MAYAVWVGAVCLVTLGVAVVCMREMRAMFLYRGVQCLCGVFVFGMCVMCLRCVFSVEYM